MRRILAILCALTSVATASPVLAQSAPNYEPSVGAGLQTTAENTGAYDTEQSSLVATASNVIQAVLATLGIVFVFLMVYAGILYLSAQGEAARVETAKRIITSAVIGTLIIVLAYAGVNFILTNFFQLEATPSALDQDRERQISITCSNADACDSNPICAGTAECEAINDPGTVVTDPCRNDPQSVECRDQQYGHATMELCDELPDLPSCCAVYDIDDPRYDQYCHTSRVIEDDIPEPPAP